MSRSFDLFMSARTIFEAVALVLMFRSDSVPFPVKTTEFVALCFDGLGLFLYIFVVCNPQNAKFGTLHDWSTSVGILAQILKFGMLVAYYSAIPANVKSLLITVAVFLWVEIVITTGWVYWYFYGLNRLIAHQQARAVVGNNFDEQIMTRITKMFDFVDITPEHAPNDEIVLCTVCQQDIVAGNLRVVLPACKHSYHAACFSRHLARHTTCCVCRGQFDKTPATAHTSIEPIDNIQVVVVQNPEVV